VTPAAAPSNVVQALTAVMRELPGIGKDSKADPRQGGYAYRGIEAITKHVQPLFAKHGVVFVPRVVSYELRDIVVNGKPWTDTVALIEYDVFGPGGRDDKITVGPLLAIGRDNSDKGGNKCETQAYKYALTQALCISDAEDDSDAASPEADSRPRSQAPPPEGEGGSEQSSSEGSAPTPPDLKVLRKRWIAAGEEATLTQADLLAYLESKWGAKGTGDLDEKQLNDDIAVFEELKSMGAERVIAFKQELAAPASAGADG
jgi:hypothetical protein